MSNNLLSTRWIFYDTIEWLYYGGLLLYVHNIPAPDGCLTTPSKFFRSKCLVFIILPYNWLLLNMNCCSLLSQLHHKRGLYLLRIYFQKRIFSPCDCYLLSNPEFSSFTLFECFFIFTVSAVLNQCMQFVMKGLLRWHPNTWEKCGIISINNFFGFLWRKYSLVLRMASLMVLITRSILPFELWLSADTIWCLIPFSIQYFLKLRFENYFPLSVTNYFGFLPSHHSFITSRTDLALRFSFLSQIWILCSRQWRVRQIYHRVSWYLNRLFHLSDSLNKMMAFFLMHFSHFLIICSFFYLLEKGPHVWEPP